MASAATWSRALRVIFISAFYQLAPPPPPPLRPPPNPPNPPPKPPPPPPPKPPPNPPPNGPTPLDQPPPLPQNPPRRPPPPPPRRLMMRIAMKIQKIVETPIGVLPPRCVVVRRSVRTPSRVTFFPCAM